MVQTDISQLSAECAEWRQILRSYKDEFQDCKRLLQETCRKTLSKDDYQQVEHFDNQFHIQLINIHDLKQKIKFHDKKIQFEADKLPEERYQEHESLLSEFLGLENMLQELRNEFRQFIDKTNC
jgi:hypothetical protein